MKGFSIQWYIWLLSREKIWVLRICFFCVQWKPRSSTSQGALDRGSYSTFCVLSAPHSPSGGVGCRFHRGQPHPQSLQHVSALNPCWFTSEQPFPQVEDNSALTMLEEVTTVESRQDVAMTLVKIYLGQGLVVPFLDYLNTKEVQHTSKNEKMAEGFLVLDHVTSADLNFQYFIILICTYRSKIVNT